MSLSIIEKSVYVTDGNGKKILVTLNPGFTISFSSQLSVEFTNGVSGTLALFNGSSNIICICNDGVSLVVGSI